MVLQLNNEGKWRIVGRGREEGLNDYEYIKLWVGFLERARSAPPKMLSPPKWVRERQAADWLVHIDAGPCVQSGDREERRVVV